MNIPESKALKTLLKPVSFFYGVGASFNLGLYSKGVLQINQSTAPVVSIGNITVGGTGKTPVVIDLANRLQSSNLKVGILSRGYKRKSTSDYVVVSDGQSILSTPEDAGDEPYLMALSCPDAVVISGSNRTFTAELAAKEYSCEIILLDDGFQHLKLGRKRNILLMDYNDKLWEEAVLPAGRLREPISGIARATDFVITKIPQNPDQVQLDKIENLIKRYAPDATIFKARFQASHLASGGERMEIESIKGKSVALLSAIARPENFKKTAQELECKIAKELIYEDHHWFDSNDIAAIKETLDTGVEFIITTEKDLVRLNKVMDEATLKNIFAVVLKTEWLGKTPDLNKLNMVAMDR